MWITKKRHKRELAKALADKERIHQIQVAAAKKGAEEKRKELSEMMEKLKVWRIEHGWGTPRGHAGYRYYRIMTEFTFEMMHGIVGGAPHFARIVAEDLRDRVYMSLLALCHIDQPPPEFDSRRPKLPLDFHGKEIAETEDIP